MIEKVLFILAAVATIAGFVLEVWRECKSGLILKKCVRGSSLLPVQDRKTTSIS